MPTELLPSGSAPPDFNLQKSHLRGSPSAITSAQKFRAKRSRNRRRKMSTCRQTRSAHLDSLGQFPSARTVIPKPSSGEKDLATEQVAATLQIPSSLHYGSLRLRPFWDPLR